MKRILSLVLAVLMVVSVLSTTAFASDFDATVSNDYFKVISENQYALAPGATETELVINNSEGNDRKVVHYFSVDTKNENIEVLPGYYGIDKLDPDNLALEGIEDKSKFWKAEQLTKTVKYYEGLGYNVVGAMNTALAYDSDAPYGYMVMNGVVLGTPEVHKGAQTYLAIDAEGNCELRSMSTPLDGSEVTAISANFDWLVKGGVLTKKTVERTSSDASRSMIGIKADGTLIFCQVDGRNVPISGGLSNYEMGEMMLSLGCVNAVNCDGGGSSTFVSKREGEKEAVMRSVPSDGSERATINSVILVSKAKPTGEFDHAVLSSDFDYYAPGTSATINVQGVDAAGSPAETPVEGISWSVSDASFGTVDNGIFKSSGKKGEVTVEMLYNGEKVGSKLLKIVDPDVFALTLDETVLPYGKSMTIDFNCTYGADDWSVCVDGAYTLTLSDNSAATLDGNTLVASSDEAIKGVNVTATYIPDTSITDVLKVTYGKGSEIIFDFEDGTTSGFVNFDDAKQYSIDNGIKNTLVGNAPLGDQFSEQVDSEVFVSNNIVKNGKHALAWSIDNTDAGFAGWTYNVIFNIGETIVLRDVANGKMATTLGMWLYIPEGAAGLAFQSQLYAKNDNGTYTCKQDHFTFETVSGVRKNLNSCSEADIPESRWVYASINISNYDYICMPVVSDESNSRSPSFVRTYIKPTVPAIHTFYIDDITLDYSSAVDDRVLPTITDVSYTIQDEPVALNEGATINSNSVSFSAVVADNIKLDNATGKIYVDGNLLNNVVVSGKYLTTTTNISLTSGVHTVVFEIKDTLGNAAKVTRTFTIAGDATYVLSGHNDSGLRPEYGSLYYVDINVDDITAVNKLTTSLLLQDANTWEPQGIEVAEGFKFDYELDKVESIITLNIEKNGEDIDSSENTIISIPVRLWTWDAIDHITGKPIAPETQYATGYCPIVSVDCKVVHGIVNDKDYFGGKISVETMINDIVNPWHYHDAELATLNKEATCTTNGYTGRTYCETCKSVIDWGTVVEATGHKFVDGKCACGKTNTFTGLVEEDGKWYYYINGIATTGWQMIGTDWYYFHEDTKAAKPGKYVVGAVEYDFEETGKIKSGVWANTLFGTRYYYGPSCYLRGWQTIEGKRYYFEDTYRFEGYRMVFRGNNDIRAWYDFGEDGACKEETIPDGFYTENQGFTVKTGGTSYVVDGMAVTGLHKINGDYYYFDFWGYMSIGKQYVGTTYCDLPVSTYEFGADGKMLNGIIEKEDGLYYYKNGKVGAVGLTKVGDEYYYVNYGGKCATGKVYVSVSNCDLGTGTYYFGDDCTLANGVLNLEDGNYYVVNGRINKQVGLTKVGDDYYYVDYDGSCRTGKFFVSAINCEGFKWDTYEFGADGKMYNGVIEKDGVYYYYINGKKGGVGLTKVGDDYYYVDYDGSCRTGKFFVSAINCEGFKWDTYEFGADGKMYNGIVEKDGIYYYYVNGKKGTVGLTKVGEDYYYVDYDGSCRTGKFFVSAINCEGFKWDTYEFSADAKMLNGIVEKEDGYYYYVNGKKGKVGLTKVGDDYYYVDYDGKCLTGKFFVSAINCEGFDWGTYEFAADGKMLNGVVEKEDGYYYYSNGKIGKVGLTKVGDDYYYVDYDGKCLTGKFFVSAINCEGFAWGTYEFAADGKMYNGIVEKEDGKLYYYEKGRYGKVGLTKYGDYFYHVNYDGSLTTSGSYFISATNGYSVWMTYTFDASGRIIG